MAASAYGRVRRALEALCTEDASGRYPYFTARQVAVRAEVAETTARKHLNYLAGCLGYGRTGYARLAMGYRVSPF